MKGPLAGLKVIEMQSNGPNPHACTLLADMGADVIRIDRPDAVIGADENAGGASNANNYPGLVLPKPETKVFGRGRRSIALDLKSDGGREAFQALLATADVLIEGGRPGVMERLGLGPEDVMVENPRLIYARMTGWGQTGVYANYAGHDLNYLAIAGVLDHLARPNQPPTPPLMYLGDYGAGSMFLLFGIFCALHERTSSGLGQVIDAAIVDGAATFNGSINSMYAAGGWNLERGTNMFDGSGPHYDVYECADGKYVSIAALEAKFYKRLLKALGLEGAMWDDQYDRSLWPERKQRLSEVFATKTQAEWCALLEPADVCFAPVLSLVEAPLHPHNISRGLFTTRSGVIHPSVAPRLSRTPGEARELAPRAGQHSRVLLREAGLTDAAIEKLIGSGQVFEG